MIDPLLQALIARLPPAGNQFPNQSQWFAAMEAALDLVYADARTMIEGDLFYTPPEAGWIEEWSSAYADGWTEFQSPRGKS